MPPATNRPIDSRELTRFVTLTIQNIEKGKDPIDNITPDHPLLRRMKQTPKGIGRKPPGTGVYVSLVYENPDRTTMLSRNSGLKEINYIGQEGVTRVNYEWAQILNNLTINKYDFDNHTSANQVVDMVKVAKMQLDNQVKGKTIDIIYNGTTVDGIPIFGLFDAVQWDPTANPTRGNLGGIDQTASDMTWWRSRVKNFNLEYAVQTSGGPVMQKVLTKGSNCLLRLYMDCMIGPVENGSVEPDLAPCNAAMWAILNDLIDQKQFITDTGDKYQLGLGSSMVYKNAQVFYDPDFPNPATDPTGAYGHMALYNSDTFQLCYAEGLEQNWGNYQMIPGLTGYSWPCATQLTMTYNQRRKNGLLMNVKPLLIS